MDIATVVGVILSLGLIIASIVTGGGVITAFIDPASVMVEVDARWRAAGHVSEG